MYCFKWWNRAQQTDNILEILKTEIIIFPFLMKVVLFFFWSLLCSRNIDLHWRHYVSSIVVYSNSQRAHAPHSRFKNKNLVLSNLKKIIFVFYSSSSSSSSTSECSAQGQLFHCKRRNQGAVLPKAGLPFQTQEPRLQFYSR